MPSPPTRIAPDCAEFEDQFGTTLQIVKVWISPGTSPRFLGCLIGSDGLIEPLSFPLTEIERYIAEARYLLEPETSTSSVQDRIAEEFEASSGFVMPGRKLPPHVTLLEAEDYRRGAEQAWNKWIEAMNRI